MNCVAGLFWILDHLLNFPLEGVGLNHHVHTTPPVRCHQQRRCQGSCCCSSSVQSQGFTPPCQFMIGLPLTDSPISSPKVMCLPITRETRLQTPFTDWQTPMLHLPGSPANLILGPMALCPYLSISSLFSRSLSGFLACFRTFLPCKEMRYFARTS
jgi:hypothetical protein